MQSIWRGALTVLLMGVACWAQAAPGEYWDSTVHMDMTGMPFAMPDRTTRVCLPKGKEKDAASNVGKDCEVLEQSVSGNRATFKVRCNQDGDVMTGTGDITFSNDRTEGRMAFSSKHGDMKVNFVNKRVGGDCDADEPRRKAEAQANQMTQQICNSVDLNAEVVIGNAEFFVGKNAACADRKDKYCAAVLRSGSAPIGYQAYKTAAYQSIPRGCGISMDTLRRNVCKSLNPNDPAAVRRFKDERVDRKVLQADCPAEYKAYVDTLRKRYCEGRGFTEQQRMSLADCLAGKEDTDESAGIAAAGTIATSDPRPKVRDKTPDMNSDKPADSSASGNPAADLIDGAKKLKNLFGF